MTTRRVPVGERSSAPGPGSAPVGVIGASTGAARSAGPDPVGGRRNEAVETRAQIGGRLARQRADVAFGLEGGGEPIQLPSPRLELAAPEFRPLPALALAGDQLADRARVEPG